MNTLYAIFVTFALLFSGSSNADHATESWTKAERSLEIMQLYAEGKPSGYGIADAVSGNAKRAIDEARAAGNQVSGLDARYAKLVPLVKLAYAERSLDVMQLFAEGKPSGYWTADAVTANAKRAIEEARVAGSQMSGLDTRYAEISRVIATR